MRQPAPPTPEVPDEALVLGLSEEITGSIRRQLFEERLMHLVLPPVMRYPRFDDYNVAVGA